MLVPNALQDAKPALAQVLITVRPVLIMLFLIIQKTLNVSVIIDSIIIPQLKHVMLVMRVVINVQVQIRTNAQAASKI